MSRAGRLAMMLTAVAVTTAAIAQESLATLSQVVGKVTVTRTADARVDIAEMRGRRVTNSSVFPGDVVATGPGASAVVAFSDGSTVELKESSKLTIQEVDLKALMSTGKASKPLGRRIRILAGDVVAKVIPNNGVATEFETPSGVAAVKGTVLEISVGRGNPK